jgi:hypothetical protein
MGNILSLGNKTQYSCQPLNNYQHFSSADASGNGLLATVSQNEANTLDFNKSSKHILTDTR